MRISDWSSDVCSSDLLGEHAVALLFLFLDVMLDLLLQNQHLGVIIFLIGLGLLKLQNQRLGRIMLDIGLVQIIFLDLAAKRRIENLFRSEEHTSELQSLMRISYAVFCLKKKNIHQIKTKLTPHKKISNDTQIIKS